MKFTKFTALMLCFMFAFLLSGCGNVQERAEKTVTGMFDAFIAKDFEAAKKYVSMNAINNGSMTDNQSMFMNNLFDKLKYNIVSSEQSDDKTVIVKTEITAVDMEPVMSQYMMTAMQMAISNNFGSSSYTEEQQKQMIEESFIKSVNDPEAATVTNTADIKVQKVDGKWQVISDDAFINALFGGLGDVTKRLEQSFDDFMSAEDGQQPAEDGQQPLD